MAMAIKTFPKSSPHHRGNRKVLRRTLIMTLLAGLFLAAPMANALAGDSPISMAGPDGQGFHLEKMNMKIALHGSLSLTEMEMVFRNPKDRQVEGKFNCTLPTGATISRFAKEVGDKLMEGEVVERKKATRVYTEILHTMRDPALLEQDQGNVFKGARLPHSRPGDGAPAALLQSRDARDEVANGALTCPSRDCRR